VLAAYASAAAPDGATAVEALRAQGCRRIAVSAYFLAPGKLYDSIARATLRAGAIAVAEPLGSAPEVVRLVLDRVTNAAGSYRGRYADDLSKVSG
jgi:sirohydrochlorin ferrochelatase